MEEVKVDPNDADTWGPTAEVVKRGSQHGGKREGAGRPSVGERRSVALTLHPSVWAAIFNELEAAGGTISMADLLRSVVTEAYWDKMELMGLDLPIYPHNKPQEIKDMDL